jgi:alanyl-tRNA synthetase
LEDERIRVVSIPDVDVIACSGTHVERTDQVGRLFVTGYGGSPPEWEFSFTVHGESRLAECGKVLRRLSRRIGCSVGEIEKVYDRVQEERGTLAKVLDKVKPYLDFPGKRSRFRNFPFVMPLFPRFQGILPLRP